MSLETQFLTLLTMIAIGAGMGAIFDAYRVLSGQLRVPRWLIPPLDIAYWILSTLLVFRGLYESNHGEVRIFVFLGLIVGGWLYMRLLSDKFSRFVLFLIGLVRRLIRLLVRTFELLVIKPIYWLYRLIVVILGFVLAIAVFLYKVVLQLLYPFRVLFRKLFGWLRPWLVIPRWMKPQRLLRFLQLIRRLWQWIRKS
ncbi:spore cortex biosynthesis protein YabQ [Paenibacillus koleovorans]|uniref:spore cortex biosynthesis protein YabQ n=1 Tax=Paenibacillus koleovorans TaxID=121608 RepID=UPI001FE57419|nr:spore cortex biosynthesis protein YabQ [Paenibacillus koleovorans]